MLVLLLNIMALLVHQRDLLAGMCHFTPLLPITSSHYHKSAKQENMKRFLSPCKCSALGYTRFITLNKYLDCPLYSDTEVGEEGRNVMFKH